MSVGMILFNTKLSTVDMEALQFVLEFFTGIKNQNIVNLINKNYRHNDSDFMKGFI